MDPTGSLHHTVCVSDCDDRSAEDIPIMLSGFLTWTSFILSADEVKTTEACCLGAVSVAKARKEPF